MTLNNYPFKPKLEFLAHSEDASSWEENSQEAFERASELIQSLETEEPVTSPIV